MHKELKKILSYIKILNLETIYIFILFLFLLSIAAFILLYKKMNIGIGEFNLKIYGITLVCILVVLLAISPIEKQNLSPAFGILGVVAGYLFGLKNN